MKLYTSQGAQQLWNHGIKYQIQILFLFDLSQHLQMELTYSKLTQYLLLVVNTSANKSMSLLVVKILYRLVVLTKKKSLSHKILKNIRLIPIMASFYQNTPCIQSAINLLLLQSQIKLKIQMI